MTMRSCSLLLAFSILALGCVDAQEERLATDESALRALASDEILGEIRPGDVKTFAYTCPPRFRAFRLTGRRGDRVDIRVHAPSGDAMAWLVDASFQDIALNDDAEPGTRDARIQAELPADGIYYAVLREKNLAADTFTVSWARSAPCDPDYETCPCNTGGACGGGGTRPFAVDPNARLALNFQETCYLRENGSLRCWGDVVPGQPAGPFKAISVGNHYDCALRADDTPICWGSQSGVATPQTGPLRMVKTKPASWGACGLTIDGRLVCWIPPANTIYEPLPGKRFTNFVNQTGFGCGATVAGEIRCWGNDAWLAVTLPPGHGLTELASTANYLCGLRDGQVRCVGPNGATTGLNLVDQPLRTLSGNGPGLVGIDRNTQEIHAIRLDDKWALSESPPRGAFKFATGGHRYGCGIRNDDKVICWGWNGRGQAEVPSDL